MKNKTHYNRKRSAKKRKEKKMNEKIAGFVKTDIFYENYDFQNRGLRKNWAKFCEFYRSGCNHLNNIFALMSCVSGTTLFLFLIYL